MPLFEKWGDRRVLHLLVGRSVDKQCPFRKYLLNPLLESCQTWHNGCPLESSYSLLIFNLLQWFVLESKSHIFICQVLEVIEMSDILCFKVVKFLSILTRSQVINKGQTVS